MLISLLTFSAPRMKFEVSGEDAPQQRAFLDNKKVFAVILNGKKLPSVFYQQQCTSCKTAPNQEVSSRTSLNQSPLTSFLSPRLN